MQLETQVWQLTATLWLVTALLLSMLVSKLVFGVESAPSVLPTIDGREVLTKDMVMALSESGEHGGGDDDGGVDGVSDNLASILIH